MALNDGSFLEKLIQVIEQLISPESCVERDVQLPILKSNTGSTAQCDLVIRTGKPPRETITIVEIQDRKKPVEINEFRGWMGKLVDVGAQHLYCVSRKPFPGSIKEAAALSGNTVKLITLNDLDVTQIPINFFKPTFIFHNADVLHIKKIHVAFPTLEEVRDKVTVEKIKTEFASLKKNDRKFSFDKCNLTALSSICIQQIPTTENVDTKKDTLDLGYNENHPFYYYVMGDYIQLRLRIEYTWSFNKTELPITTMSYDQDDHGALAWVLESYYVSTRGPIWVKIPVIKDGNEFILSGMFITTPFEVEYQMRLERE